MRKLEVFEWHQRYTKRKQNPKQNSNERITCGVNIKKSKSTIFELVCILEVRMEKTM